MYSKDDDGDDSGATRAKARVRSAIGKKIW